MGGDNGDATPHANALVEPSCRTIGHTASIASGRVEESPEWVYTYAPLNITAPSESCVMVALTKLGWVPTVAFRSL